MGLVSKFRPSPAMIVALLNQQGAVGRTTLALHLADEWAREGKRVLLINADPQRSTLQCAEQRAKVVEGHVDSPARRRPEM